MQRRKKERKNFRRDMGRQRARFGPQHTTKAHLSVPIERLPKRRPVRGDGIFGALIRQPGDRRQKTVCISPRDRCGHRGLGREVMMDACAFDADLRRKFAKAKTPIASVPNMGFGQIHQPLGSFIQRRRSGPSTDRERARKGLALFRR
jgi:hypothetical protein